MLDKLSRNIMYELFKDGRCSNSAIAKKLGISVITVSKKISAMIRDKVISIKAVPSQIIMGNHVGALIGLNIDIRKIDTICTQLYNMPNINIMVSTFGRFDLFLMVYFPDLTTLENFTKIKLKEIDGIRSVSTFLTSDININPSLSNQLDLDKIDWKIITELMNDGRPNYATLAKKIGTSKSTISRRILSLLDKDVIKIVAIPNMNLNYLADALILINVDFSKIDDICNKLSSYPETDLVMKLLNDYDIMLTIRTTDCEELHKFIANELFYIDGVIQSETFLVANLLYFSAQAMFMYSIEEC